MLRLKTILHPTDFSPCSGHAFDMACSLARDHGGRVVILHVVEDSNVVPSGVMMAPPAPPLEDPKTAQERLQQICPADTALPFERLLLDGDPVTAILQVAKDSKTDLIVMGTHGHSGLVRLLMGSVAEKVLRNAQCPVMTIKAGT